MRLIVLFLAGLLFGLGLSISGMTDPSKVVGFLDITGDWNPALAFVMGGALVTFSLGLIIARRLGSGRGWFHTKIPKGESEPINRRLIIGSALFGVGWGIGGFCPGPAIANLAALRADAAVFVLTMLLGMVIAQRTVGVDR